MKCRAIYVDYCDCDDCYREMEYEREQQRLHYQDLERRYNEEQERLYYEEMQKYNNAS